MITALMLISDGTAFTRLQQALPLLPGSVCHSNQQSSLNDLESSYFFLRIRMSLRKLDKKSQMDSCYTDRKTNDVLSETQQNIAIALSLVLYLLSHLPLPVLPFSVSVTLSLSLSFFLSAPPPPL